MNSKSTFKRYELKYIITKEQKELLKKAFQCHMAPDEYGQSNIQNLYYDTDDFLLIRRSVEKPVYKEKLRLRSYGKAESDTEVFLELKKKYDDIVYKRRLSLTQDNATKYFKDEYMLSDTQIAKEINYFKCFYKGLRPKVFIGYDREAFFANDDSDLRITFDENIVWRTDNLSLCSESYGNSILPDGMVLLEIKVAGGIPLWLTHFLTHNRIFRTSFSKYGAAYEQILKDKKGDKNAA